MGRIDVLRATLALSMTLASGCARGDDDRADAADCGVSAMESDTGFPETRGEGAEAWALLWDASPWPVGEEVKVVWRMEGTGDFEVRAIGPAGEIVQPTAGPTRHGGSNWDRPGEEWGTFFALPTEGCWQLEARRSDDVSTVTIEATTA